MRLIKSLATATAIYRQRQHGWTDGMAREHDSSLVAPRARKPTKRGDIN